MRTSARRLAGRIVAPLRRERVRHGHWTVGLRRADEPIELRLLEESTREYRGTLVGDAGRGLSQDLTYRVEANDASVEAQRMAQSNQEAELSRINRLYDAELDRLRRLWTGTPAGSLGPLTQQAQAQSAEAVGRPQPTAVKSR